MNAGDELFNSANFPRFQENCPKRYEDHHYLRDMTKFTNSSWSELNLYTFCTT